MLVIHKFHKNADSVKKKLENPAVLEKTMFKSGLLFGRDYLSGEVNRKLQKIHLFGSRCPNIQDCYIRLYHRAA